TATLGGLVFALIEGPSRGWTSAAVLVAFAATPLLAMAFVAAERRHPAPLVDLKLLGQPVFAAANLTAAALMFVMLATSVYISAFLQPSGGASALRAGFALLPLGAATAVFAGLSGRLTARAPARRMIAIGLLCAAAGALLLSRVGDTLWPA